MQRNLSSRVEAVTPIEDPRLKEQVEQVLRLSLNDYRHCWEMLPDGRYRQRRAPAGAEEAVVTQGVQATLMQHVRATTLQ
jgi:polyphosphate kinase